MPLKAVTICLLAGLLAGCSSVTVIKNPAAQDTGIRYWRPKPYLLVTPADATGRMVKLKMEYLPDYSEEFSIHPQGKKPPQVQLKDGWNLVAVGGPAPPPEKPEEAALPAASPAGDPMKLPEYVVAATNIPIGYYESVFDGVGTKKHLKGWRYVGMTPMGGGLPNGGTTPGCPPTPATALPGPLYGMVFFNGVMTFRQLDEIANHCGKVEWLGSGLKRTGLQARDEHRQHEAIAGDLLRVVGEERVRAHERRRRRDRSRQLVPRAIELCSPHLEPPLAGLAEAVYCSVT